MSFKKKILIVILAALSIPATYYLIIPGFYEPHDLHHVADIYQMYKAFESGQLPPRLGPDFTFGYGYPLFNFYYVLPFYIGAFWFWLFGNLTASFEFVFVLSAGISIVGMYLFLREYFSKWPAMAGAVLYLYTPYRALQIYVRGAMGEALAVAIMPFVFWLTVRLLKNPTLKNSLALGVVGALFILSHNYLWMLAGVWIVIFILLLYKKNLFLLFKHFILAGVFASGLSFYWWFPAFSEYKMVSSLTPFRMEDHFPFIRQLVVPSWGYGPSVWGPGDEISFQIGLVNLAAIALVFLTLVRYRRAVKHVNIAIFVVIGFLITVFFMNIRSLPLWKLLPIYQFVQFPWRLLFLTTFFSSLGLALFVENVRHKKTAALVLITLALLFTVSYFRPSSLFYKSDNEYLDRMFADQTIKGKKDKVSEDYLNWSEDYLLLPHWTQKRPERLPDHKISSKTATVSDINEITPVHWSARVIADHEAEVEFHSYFFPGWYAKTKSQNLEISPGEPYGQVVVNVPSGDHEVEFYWAETPLRKTADFISLGFVILTVGVCFYERKKEKNT